MTNTDSRSTWRLADGTPTPHLVRAALHVAGLIDTYGSSVAAAHHGYAHYPSGGIYPPEDLRRGERLLLDCGLVREQDGVLYPTPLLPELVETPQAETTELLLGRALITFPPLWLDKGESPTDAALSVVSELIPDPDRREAFLLALANRYDPTSLCALGARGEDAVVDTARAELEALGRPDLASLTKRVSLISDQLGYDVVAPRIDQRTRRLEVKTTNRRDEGVLHVVLTRNEIETGRRDSHWALVVCQAYADGMITVEGWCRAGPLDPYLPVDGPGGHWLSVSLTIPRTLLYPRIPSPL